MADDLDRLRQGFAEAREFARTYRFEMTAEYRALIARVEAMPRNQSGVEKGGRWIGSYADAKAFFAAFSRATQA